MKKQPESHSSGRFFMYSFFSPPADLPRRFRKTLFRLRPPLAKQPSPILSSEQTGAEWTARMRLRPALLPLFSFMSREKAGRSSTGYPPRSDAVSAAFPIAFLARLRRPAACESARHGVGWPGASPSGSRPCHGPGPIPVSGLYVSGQSPVLYPSQADTIRTCRIRFRAVRPFLNPRRLPGSLRLRNKKASPARLSASSVQQG